MRVDTPQAPQLPQTRFGQSQASGPRLYMPGGEWVFLKLYCDPDRLERLLVEHVLPFADDCVAAALAERWFYLFYRDPDPHLRLRLLAPDVEARGRLFVEIERRTAELASNGQVRDVAIAPYEREIERYGGAGLIPYAEQYFCRDSEMCARLVAAHITNETSFDRVQLMAIGAADIVLRAADNAPVHALVAGKLSDRTRFGESFRELCGRLWLSRNNEDGESAWIKRMLDRRAGALDDYLAAMRVEIPEDRLEPERLAIMTSLIHMQCNRMNGDEPAARALAKRIVTWVMAKRGGFATPVIT
jgi:thiopeptide-type bacteriocin biosynthesis protein